MNFPAQEPAQSKAGDIFERALAFLLAGAPFILVLAPRLAAFLTPALGLLSFAGFILAYRRSPAFPKTVFAMPLIIILMMAASGLWSADPGATWEQTFKTAPILLGAALLFSVVTQIPGEKHVHLALRFFPLFLILAGALCLVDLYGEGLLYYFFNGHEQRFSLSKLNRGVITLFLFSILALPILLGERRKQAALLFAVILAVLYKTESQAAQLGLIVAAAFYFFFPYNKNRAWAVFKAALVFALFAAPFIALWMFHALAGYAAAHSWLETGYATHRLEIWDFISRRALESPVYGFGAESTRSLVFDSARLYHPANYVLHPHNFILQLWIEFGIIGPVLATGFFALLLKPLPFLPAETARRVLPAFGAVLVIAAITYGLWQGWWVGLLGLLAVYGRLMLRAGNFSAPAK